MSKVNKTRTLFFVYFMDEEGLPNYVSEPLFDDDEVIGWAWTRDIFDAKMFRQHSKAFKMAQNLTDPNEGPVWLVRAAELKLK